MKKEQYINIDDEAIRELEEDMPAEVAEAIMCDPMTDFIRDMDVRTTVESLPETERNICLMLLEGCSYAEVCRTLKIQRADLTGKHLPFIRQRFLDYGFEKHEINL